MDITTTPPDQCASVPARVKGGCEPGVGPWGQQPPFTLAAKPQPDRDRATIRRATALFRIPKDAFDRGYDGSPVASAQTAPPARLRLSFRGQVCCRRSRLTARSDPAEQTSCTGTMDPGRGAGLAGRPISPRCWDPFAAMLRVDPPGGGGICAAPVCGTVFWDETRSRTASGVRQPDLRQPGPRPALTGRNSPRLAPTRPRFVLSRRCQAQALVFVGFCVTMPLMDPGGTAWCSPNNDSLRSWNRSRSMAALGSGPRARLRRLGYDDPA
jgi:hypothetical protein